MPFEDRVHGAALHADAAAVDEAHLGEPVPVRLVDVLLDHGGHVPRGERVQVEGGVDGHAMGLGCVHG